MELNQTTRQRLESFITEIPPRLLHTAGLACFFLTAAPSTSGAGLRTCRVCHAHGVD